MKLSDDAIYRLRSSVNRLVERNLQLDKENKRLAKLHVQQKQELEETKQKLEDITSKFDKLALATSIIEVSGGTKVARQRVNNLLRDIDRCISLVNK